MNSPTPMLRQYLEIKKQFPGTLLFFRMGDFYELFNEDAVIGAREMEITLTARHKDSPNPVPMCGVPHHSAAGYIAKLVKKGYRVAVCEQTEQPSKGTKLVKREVVRVITPGTAIDPQLLEKGEPNYLAAVYSKDERVAVSFLDTSTGDFSVTEETGPQAWAKIAENLFRYQPKEVLMPGSRIKQYSDLLGIDRSSDNRFFPQDGHEHNYNNNIKATISAIDNDIEHHGDGRNYLLDHFKIKDISVFGLAGKDIAVNAAAICLRYVKETQRADASHITALEYFDNAEYLMLDPVSLANLELIKNKSGSTDKTLLSVIDETVTGMGGRLLQAWLLRPSIKRSEIQTRLSAVTELTDTVLRDKIRFLLKQIADLERLIGRLNLGTATPRDLLSLKHSLDQTPEINAALSDSQSLLLQVLSENIFELPDVRLLVERSIDEEASAKLSDGWFIKKGFDSELDELRDISGSVKQSIAAFENAERDRTGINNLKVRFNNVFGYYIEISKAQLSRVPDDYERRQTLVNAERFSTPQLKEWEEKVLGAEEKMAVLEIELYRSIVDTIAGETVKIQSAAKALATLDCLASLAETAVKRRYISPELHDGDEIAIKNGRHPVVESVLRDEFVPNDIYLNNSTDRLLIVTGANMGGKSTILRQIALIQILGQIGSFVPANSARLPIVDRIWTRVGASDDLASGRSTFMVEMTETASILHGATPRSLILLDEIGRGTSTFDGLSIAWAVAEYLYKSSEHSAKTMFATHYHEMTELAELLPGAKNYRMAASENSGDVIFLHKLQEGKASKSYGIAVAKLAGLPSAVIERAKDVLSKLEKYELAVLSGDSDKGIAAAASKAGASQFSLFAISNESVVDELRGLNIDEIKPEEAKDLLKELQSKVV